ncbi:MAG: TauD/TfdA family dioxygenase [Acidobacteriota bacterium]
MKKLPLKKRRRVAAGDRSPVRQRPLTEGQSLPWLIEPAAPGLDLVAWAGEHREELNRLVSQHGGILFRGFGVGSVEVFESLVRAVGGDLLRYRDRATPRSRVAGKVYTSTDFPPDQGIELHNENCYAHTFPMKVFFCCLQPAQQGGETPIADSRRVYDELDPKIRQRFVDRGVTYLRNFLPDVGLDWRTTFDVTDREELETFCRQARIDCEWRGEALRARQTRPAVAVHPQTGEKVWFNQATAFHVSTLDPALGGELVAQFGAEGVPKTTCFGDGAPLEEDDLSEIRRAFARVEVSFPWQQGDVLMLDNMLVAHGRRPFEGPRKVIVGMAEPMAADQIWSSQGGAFVVGD